ncbi:protein-tyrosine phosphatase family protein [Stieleria sedimenti]|uniref:tyrosine-protein phosphatase n=1 Tax=Stieleria sedimenti TaxID=2976331 RepID=UPI00217F9A27|nr:tyrosine-protein phosphatase [Stieleria sedimenti]
MLILLIVASSLVLACSDSCGAMDHPGDTLDIHHLDGQIYYGAAPKSDVDFAKLRRLGVQRIIDVRTFKVFASGKEKRRAAKLGIAYRRIPMGFFPIRTGNVPTILAQLTSGCAGPVYFHCNLGLDRVGLLVALYRIEYFGWEPRHAFTTWKAQQFNTNLEGLDRYFWQHVGAQSCLR